MALPSGTALVEADARVSWLAFLFHDVPHIDYTFTLVNSTFDPKSNLYLESIGIIASIPGFWLILNLLAFLIFFLSRCCEREWKSKNLTCYKWFLGFLAICCCGALGIGFYGNDDAHDGMETLTGAIQNINGVINSVKNQTFLIEQTLEENVGPELKYLERIFQHKIANKTAQDLLQEAVQSMHMEVVNSTNLVTKINSRIHHLDISSAPDVAQQIEFIRWPVTMAGLSILMLFCIILLAGVISSSRSTLIAFTVLGLLAVIINWLLVSIYLASCVALGDLCVDPDLNLLRHVGTTLDKSIVNYYLECSDSFENPFAKAIKNGQKAIDNVKTELKFISRDAGHYYRERDLPNALNNLNSHLNSTEVSLENLSSLLSCTRIHRQYNIAVTSCCTPVLNGLAFMLLSAASAGLLFILLIWIAAQTWMYIRKNKTCADNGRIPRGAEDHSPLHGRYTPPPSYEQLTAFLPSAPIKLY